MRAEHPVGERAQVADGRHPCRVECFAGALRQAHGLPGQQAHAAAVRVEVFEDHGLPVGDAFDLTGRAAVAGRQHGRWQRVEAPVVAEGAVEPELAELGAVDTADLQAELAAGRVLDPHPPRQAAAGIGLEERQMGRCAGQRQAVAGRCVQRDFRLDGAAAQHAGGGQRDGAAAEDQGGCHGEDVQTVGEPAPAALRRARVLALRRRGQLAGEGLIWVSHACSFTSRLSVARPRETRLRTTCCEHPMPAAIAS